MDIQQRQMGADEDKHRRQQAQNDNARSPLNDLNESRAWNQANQQALANQFLEINQDNLLASRGSKDGGVKHQVTFEKKGIHEEENEPSPHRLGHETQAREAGSKKGKQPMFLKKKNPKHLGMQKQFSSTLQIGAPDNRVDQEQHLTEIDANLAVNGAAANPVNFEMGMHEDGAENGQVAEVWMPTSETDVIKQNFENSDNLQQKEIDLAELINNPMNLESSHNILDQILDNLQGLTAEQEEQKRQIEQRTTMIQERTAAQIQKKTEVQSMEVSLKNLQIPQSETPIEAYSQPAQNPNVFSARDSQTHHGYLTAGPQEVIEAQKAKRRQQLKDDLLKDFTELPKNLDNSLMKPLFPESPKDEEMLRKQRRKENYHQMLDHKFNQNQSKKQLHENRLNLPSQKGTRNQNMNSQLDQFQNLPPFLPKQNLNKSQDLLRDHIYKAQPKTSRISKQSMSFTQTLAQKSKKVPNFMRHTQTSAQKDITGSNSQNRDNAKHNWQNQFVANKELKNSTGSIQDLSNANINAIKAARMSMQYEGNGASWVEFQNSSQLQFDQSSNPIGNSTQRYGAKEGPQAASRSMILTQESQEQLQAQLLSTSRQAVNKSNHAVPRQHKGKTKAPSLRQSSQASLGNEFNNGITQARGGPKHSGTRTSARNERMRSQGATSKHNLSQIVQSANRSNENGDALSNSQSQLRAKQAAAIASSKSGSKSNLLNNANAQLKASVASSRRQTCGQNSFNATSNRNAVIQKQGTMKIHHRGLQKEIEIAIKEANSNDDDEINFIELKHCLFNLDYLTILKSFESSNSDKAKLIRSHQMISDLEDENELLWNIWVYLNPYSNESIGKASTFDFMLHFMFNVVYQSERDLQRLLAQHLIEYYKQFDIQLRQAQVVEQQVSQNQDEKNSEALILGNHPRGHPNEMQAAFGDSNAQRSFSGQGIRSAKSSQNQGSFNQHDQTANASSHTTANTLDDIQLVDRYLVKRKRAWPLHKFVQAFKQNHAKRFSTKMLTKSSLEQSVNNSMLADPEIRRNKSLQRVLPHDNRKYKDDSITHLINNYTFSPRMSTKSNKLAQKYHEKMIERSKSRSKLTIVPELQKLEGKSNGKQNAISNQYQEKLQCIQLRQEQISQRLEAQRQLKIQKGVEECTFAPKTNKEVKNKYKKNDTSGYDVALHGEDQQSHQARPGQYGHMQDHQREPMESKKVLMARIQKQRHDQEEQKECTFKPKINQMNPKMYLNGVKSQAAIRKNNHDQQMGQSNQAGIDDIQVLHSQRQQHLELILENNVPKQMPRGYAKVVERMRKHQEQKQKQKLDEEKKTVGERYGKERLDKMKPPSFLTRPFDDQRYGKKRNLLLSIEVSITPTRSGRIGISKGDDLRRLAQNFCKAYSLNKDMEGSLVIQLQAHLDNYWKKKEVQQKREQQKQEQQRQQLKLKRKMMANRFGDLSPSSSRACGLEEQNDENDANGKAPADRDSQKANLMKVLEMPMYDNEDLGSDKIQEVNARSNSFHDAEASQNSNEKDRGAAESQQNLQSAVIDQIQNASASLHEVNDLSASNYDVLTKLQQANYHYYDGDDSAEEPKSEASPATHLASLELKSGTQGEANPDTDEEQTN